MKRQPTSIRLVGLLSLLAAVIVTSWAWAAPTTPETDPAAPAAAGQEPQVAHSVLLVGDSLSIGLGKELERIFAENKSIAFARLGKVSSGLARPDFFDWERNLDDLARAQAPDTVIIMIGANDNKPLVAPDGSHVNFEDAGWEAAYAEKARRLVAICRAHRPDVQVFWIGAPVMGDAVLDKDMIRVNAALEAMCRAESGCRFVDVRAALADPEGRFAAYAKTGSGELAPIRVDDGVHVTVAGSRILAEKCLDAAAPVLGLDKADLLAEAGGLTPIDAEEARKLVAEEKASQDKLVAEGGEAYLVKNGESLWRIAKKRGLTMESLIAANPGLDPDKVGQGQSIVIPAKKAGSGKPDMAERLAAAKEAAASMHANAYQVRPGDTLWAVAQRFDVSAARIVEANPGLKPKALRPGMTLDIPQPEARTAVATAPAPAAQDAPAPVAAPSAPAMTAQADPGKYAVADGDNYWTIAQRLGISPAALQKANPGVDPRRLRPGQLLNAPASEPKALAEAAPSAAEQAVAPAADPSPTGGVLTHHVEEGESFWRIARRFGVTVSALQKANQGVNPKTLQPGQMLAIPERSATASASETQKTRSPGAVGSRNDTEINANQYPVESGDTLWALSRRFGVDLAKLIEVNGDMDPRRLQIGAKLVIPTPETAQIVPVVVAAGDTLWDIAKARNCGVADLMRANPGVDPLRLRIGQVILAPATAAAEADAPQKTGEERVSSIEPANPAQNVQSYAVLDGDTLSSVAKRFGVSVDNLVAANNLDNPDALRIGQVLTIPTQAVTLLNY